MSYSKRYRSYRSHHGVFSSFTLAVHPALWYGSAALLGVAFAIIFWSDLP